MKMFLFHKNAMIGFMKRRIYVNDKGNAENMSFFRLAGKYFIIL